MRGISVCSLVITYTDIDIKQDGGSDDKRMKYPKYFQFYIRT